MERRRFIVKAVARWRPRAACRRRRPNVIAQPKIQWRMSTASALDAASTGGSSDWPRSSTEMSGGRFRIEVFPAARSCRPFECFDAASKARSRRSWRPAVLGRREPALEWFATVPFGMNAEGMTAWFYQGDGLKLWEEATPPSTSCRALHPVAPQMAGGSAKKITTIGDFKGLKMRIAISAARSRSRRAARRCSPRQRDLLPPSSGASSTLPNVSAA
jgi:TRAP-type mannitol/chloroaromatic compound transport system substrate-binding protein